MSEFPRLAAGGDVIEPAAGELLLFQARDSLGEDVDPAEVIQEPAVEPLGPDRGLNRQQVEHGQAPNEMDRINRMNRIQKGKKAPTVLCSILSILLVLSIPLLFIGQTDRFVL